MTMGLILVGWDQKMGSIIDATYPESFSISRDLINKILMTHTFSQNLEPEFLEMKYSDFIIFSYCDKTKVHRYGYEMVVLIVNQSEESVAFELKNQFENVKKLGRTSREKRVQEFLAFARTFFKKRLSKKILLIGLPSTGKTTIKNVFFEGSNADGLLASPIEPTRGFSHFIYKWLDLELGLADSSGQEINSYLTPGPDQKLAFGECDAVVYNFDYLRWIEDKETIFKNLDKIIEILQQISSNAQIFVFCHKIDLIEENHRAEEFSKISDEFKNKFNIPLFFTSIDLQFIHLLYKALLHIMSCLSPLSSLIGKMFSKAIGHSTKTLAMLLNKDSSIINQFVSSDYNFSNGIIIKEYYSKANSVLQKIRDNRIEKVQIIGSNSLNILIKNLIGIHDDIEGLVLVSESFNLKELDELSVKIKQELILLESPQKEIVSSVTI